MSLQNPLIKLARQETVFLASSMLDRCLQATAAALEEAGRAAPSVPQRLQLGDAGHALTQRRAILCADFPSRLDRAVTGALQAASEASAQPAARAPLADDELALVEDAEVSRFVEASRLQQTALPVVDQTLVRLDSLMSSALGLPVVRADLNPLRPDVVCGALLETLEAQPQAPELRALWVRHIARPFAQELERLYAAVVELLEAQGVEEARYRLRLTEGLALPPGAGAGGQGAGGSGGSGLGGAGGRPGGGSTVELSAEAEQLRQRRLLFPRMSDLAQARSAVPRALMRDFLYRPQWVAENDEPLPPAYYDAVQAQSAALAQAPVERYDEAAAARTRARAQALAVVDRPARPVAVEQALAPSQWGEAASAQARTRTLMALKSRASRISQALGLDAVRTLVGQVAGDERVLAPVREAFVALEPALLRLAMADPRFLGDENHAARRLIEGVAQRSFNYNDEYAQDFEQFMAPVRQAVRELNALPEAGPEPFATRLQALEADWRRQDDAEGDAREHGLRSMQFAQERQALADKVAWEFSLRSDLDGVPHVVADFLFKDWSLVIAHAQLTDERGQLDPGGYLAVVTDLLWSVKREAALKAPARLFEVVPGIVRTLRRGLEMLGKEPEETTTFFDALMRHHDPVLRLRRMRSAQDAEASGFSRRGDATDLAPLDDSGSVPLERPQPRAAEQPWLGRHELAAAGFHDAGADSGAVPVTAEGALDDDASPATVSDGTDTFDESRDDFTSTLPTETAELDPPAMAEPAPQQTPPSEVFVPLDQAAAVPAPEAPPPVPAAASERPEDVEARTRDQLARLRTGHWVDLKVRGHWRRAQLQWTSDNGALFMFISRGGRPHSMTRRTCEKLLRNRHLRPVDAGAVVDQALRRLGDEARSPREPALA